MKAIARVGKTILELTEGAQPITECDLIGHELSKFFPILQRVFSQVGWDWNVDLEGLRSFKELEQLLKDFDDIDKGSYTFRYPLDTKEQASVPHHFMFSVPNFCHRMDDLLDLLQGATIELREMRFSLLEQTYHMQNAEE